METLKEIIHALMQHDYMVLANPNVLWVIYIVLFVIIMLENWGFTRSIFTRKILLLYSMWCTYCESMFYISFQPS
ncbi:hypothetical protein ABE79_00195, partial [Proteus mirabilis]